MNINNIYKKNRFNFVSNNETGGFMDTEKTENSFWYSMNKVDKIIQEHELIGIFQHGLEKQKLSNSTIWANMHIYEKWRDFLHTRFVKGDKTNNKSCVIYRENKKACLDCPSRVSHVNYALKYFNLSKEEFFENRYTEINNISVISDHQFEVAFREFIKELQETPKDNGEFRSPNTIATYIKQIKRWAKVVGDQIGRELTFADSFKVKEVRTIVDPIPPLNLKKVTELILNNSQELTSNVLNAKRLKALYFLMLQTGLRQNEVVNLNQKDMTVLKDGTGELKILGKGSKERIVGLSQETVLFIKDYLKARFSKVLDNEPALFINSSFERMTKYTIISTFKAISRHTGVKVSSHDIRRTSATLMVQNGSDILDIMKVFGWSSQEVARRYMESAQTVQAIEKQKVFNPYSVNETVIDNQEPVI